MGKVHSLRKEREEEERHSKNTPNERCIISSEPTSRSYSSSSNANNSN